MQWSISSISIMVALLSTDNDATLEVKDQYIMQFREKWKCNQNTNVNTCAVFQALWYQPVLPLHQASHVELKPLHTLLEHTGTGERTIIFAVPSAVHPQLQQPRSTAPPLDLFD